MVPPAEFVCPLTKELMSEPMVTRYGVRFERKAILEWLDQGNSFCPVTSNPLRVSNLLSDKNFQWKIQYWAEKNGCADKVIIDDEAQDHAIVLTGAIPADRFICPITHDVMKEPMMSRLGHNFEKAAILKALDKNGSVCPLSGKPMLPSDLVSNHKLQWEIKQWQMQYGEAYDEKSQLELDFKLSKAKMVSQGYQTADIIKALVQEDGSTSDTETSESQDSDPNVLSCLDEVIGTIQ
mmetsp:Transcript_127012/g.189450  ORF Transcript_127012/g.189450 Transcript_127012/m.189450 type:complete len:237 (+) Transcript_127012:62-772(+)|eukprot:CAMPEP_0116998186 /NCGR_PEP_ID=MMETSP0472-20121206/1345_1 /TAXON_ID=693140 ORGANISM="Tiarina fusus, Strain LIS" /NCGR_SAMPLE_ID=MMETSP0472 /ASSEMBLY_ACC=CAM_ASM_000603 /LENGTH=236 /DNA_ID=CAMNT_0004697261 /DNA_START=62 /DNA_END=772 /DNA_ORIENTATION=-